MGVKKSEVFTQLGKRRKIKIERYKYSGYKTPSFYITLESERSTRTFPNLSIPDIEKILELAKELDKISE